MTTPTLIEAARAALDALTCSDEDDGPGHRCSHCDDYVDRNGPVRTALRAAIEAAEGAQPEPARQPMTETEAWNCICSVGPSVFDLRLLAHLNQLVRAVEAFHRIGVKTVGPESQRQRKDSEPEIAFLRRVADARQQIIDGMIAERCAKQDAEMPRPLADWHEDDGAVVWWRFLVDEPAWIGTPLDDDWPGYHTHWTPHPKLPERER